jgi:hypothetical protein
MANPFNMVDSARLGHRFQVRLENSVVSPSRVIICSRVQRFEPQVRQDTAIYHELGSVDPTGFSSDPPQHRITIEEFVHAVDVDLIMAGQLANATAWNLGQYNVGNGPYNVYLLQRDNAGALAGELKFTAGVISEVTWSWRMGSPITASYAIDCRLGQNFQVGSELHTFDAQDTSNPGGIRIKDARLFLGGNAAGNRMYRLQSFTLRAVWRTTPVNEAGNRAIVGYLAEPPDTSLDFEVAAADQQPDSTLYASSGTLPNAYYDYQNSNTLAANAIRIYDPTAAEGNTVLRSWLLEKLIVTTSSPLSAVVRGLATKRYSLVVPSVTTAGTAGVKLFSGDIVP